MTTRAKVLVVDDHEAVRLGVRHYLSQQPDFVVCAEAADAPKALSAAAKRRPELALVDLHLSQSSGLDLIKDLHHQFPAVRIVVFTVCDNPVWVERVFRVGAHGFVQKNEELVHVTTALRTVLRGGHYVSPAISLQLAAKLALRQGETHSPWDRLSDRESEILDLLGRGEPCAAIATKLHRTVSTVQTHVDRLKEKFGVRDLRTLVQLATERRVRSDRG